MASGNPHTYSAILSKTYSSFVSDIDLLAASPGGGTTSSQRPCRRIRLGSSGTLVLKYLDGTSDTITNLLQGDVLDVQAETIVASGTTITGCTVFW